MMDRGAVLDALEAMVDYASITQDGRAVLLSAIRIIREGDDLERAEKILEASERMLTRLREEYAALQGMKADKDAAEMAEECG